MSAKTKVLGFWQSYEAAVGSPPRPCEVIREFDSLYQAGTIHRVLRQLETEGRLKRPGVRRKDPNDTLLTEGEERLLMEFWDTWDWIHVVPTLKYVTERLEMSYPYATRLLAEIERKGWVRRGETPYSPSRYRGIPKGKTTLLKHPDRPDQCPVAN